jgi:hypothetical protein
MEVIIVLSFEVYHQIKSVAITPIYNFNDIIFATIGLCGLALLAT